MAEGILDTALVQDIPKHTIHTKYSKLVTTFDFLRGIVLFSIAGAYYKKVKTENSYSDYQKTMEQEDDIITIFNCIWWYYKANTFTRHL